MRMWCTNCKCDRPIISKLHDDICSVCRTVIPDSIVDEVLTDFESHLERLKDDE